MALYEIQGPDGATYEVEAPNEEAALGRIRSMSAPDPQVPAPSPDQLGMQPPAPSKAYTGSFLPFSRDSQGRASFDSNAGILGSIKSGLGLPGDVATGVVPMRQPSENPDMSRVADLAGLGTPINPAIRAGDKAFPGVAKALMQGRAAVPTAGELKAAGSKGYDAVRDMGVDYASDAVSGVARGMKGTLERDGIIAELAPKTHAIIDRLGSAPDGSVAPLSGLDAARRSLGKLSKSLDATEKEAARRAGEAIDDFIQAADPATVVAGDAAAAGKTLTEARGNWGAGKRAEQLNTTEQNAGLRASAANSGANTDNSIRQRIASLLISPNKLSGYSGAEREALTGVAEGTAARNAVRTAGNMMGGGLGLGGTLLGGSASVLGSLLSGPGGALIGASVPLVGAAVKRGGGVLTRRALNEADEMVRMRSPLYEERAAAMPLEGAPVTPQSVIARSLLERLFAGPEAQTANPR